MLETLIKRYKKEPVREAIFKLSYGGCFIIVKAADVAGALFRMDRDYGIGEMPSQTALGGIYGHFWAWVGECIETGVKSKFRVKILFKVGDNMPTKSGRGISVNTGTAYDLLKVEQNILWAFQTNSACLNANYETYIPKYNKVTGMYGWFSVQEVRKFEKWKNERNDFHNTDQPR